MFSRIPSYIIAGLGLATTSIDETNDPAKTLVTMTPRVPAIGIELAENVDTHLRKKTDALGQAIQALPNSMSIHQHFSATYLMSKSITRPLTGP